MTYIDFTLYLVFKKLSATSLKGCVSHCMISYKTERYTMCHGA